ncbi:MAG: hypothetical protein EXR63_00010 [Dehalococcoidia bacterium]|nr:hypothetical protein [Dehalococcoidia bacterium]
MAQDWQALNRQLMSALGSDIPPIAITFHDTPPAGVRPFDDPMPAPHEVDGRTGRVSAGCVFWMKSTDRTFSTVAEDHANCSVGSVTHGFKTLAEVGGNADVAALLESGWVTMDVVPQIPVVTQKPAAVTYGPLAECSTDPDVVLCRISARQFMVVMDALPGVRVEGKPQCHIIAIAKEQGEVAVSAGCQLSRVRTGMPNSEMTLAIPTAQLASVIERIEATAACDNAVARYAADDMRRFAAT